MYLAIQTCVGVVGQALGRWDRCPSPYMSYHDFSALYYELTYLQYRLEVSQDISLPNSTPNQIHQPYIPQALLEYSRRCQLLIHQALKRYLKYGPCYEIPTGCHY